MALDLHPLKSGVFERSVVLALAHVAWEMTSAEGLPGWKVPELRKGLMSLLLERSGDRRLITAAQNTDALPLELPK